MSAIKFDANGKRITTEVLIGAFAHETATKCHLMVPDEIISVIFMFWFIDVCDEWDQSLICEGDAIVNGQWIKQLKRRISFFGIHCVKHGSYEWKIKTKSNIKGGYGTQIGIVRGNTPLSDPNCVALGYCLGDRAAVLSQSGTLYSKAPGGPIENYCEEFGKLDTMIIMRLNMHERTICYNINGKQYGTEAIYLDWYGVTGY